MTEKIFRCRQGKGSHEKGIKDVVELVPSNYAMSETEQFLLFYFQYQILANDMKVLLYTYLQNKRMRRCGVPPPPPPPIIFERLKLPQQIIYRRKENLSESPNHQKYWENILVSRFYEQFSRNRRNLGHFRKFEKISNS